MSDSNLTQMFPLRVVVMPTRAPVQGNDVLYNEAYNTWQKCWKEALFELDGTSELPCDHFTRQDYAVALFHGQKCAALIFFRRIDPKLEAHRNDSYFEAWPKDFLATFGEANQTAMICSWITTLPEYRRTLNNPALKNLDLSLRLSEVMNYFMQDVQADVTFGTVRINRSADKMCAYSGSRTVMKDRSQHGVAVDLITWVPKDLPAASDLFPQIARDMWDSRTVYHDEVLSISNPAVTNRRNSKKAV